MRGPYNTSYNPPGFRDVLWIKSSYRQDYGVKVRKPLPYDLTYRSVKMKTTWSTEAGLDAGNGLQYMGSWGRSSIGDSIQKVHNECYAKFLDKVRSAPALGVDFAERVQTYKMVGQTVKALRRPLQTFAHAVRRYSRKPVTATLRDMPNAWLAWHFGVEPLIKDLYDLLERLEQPAKAHPFNAYRKRTGTWSSTQNGLKIQETWKWGVRIAAHVQRIDDNLSLINDCGLVNPANIAWELVPFSFVVDWFYPVGQILNSYTDLLGYKIQDPYVTWYLDGSEQRTYSYPITLGTNKVAWTGYRIQRRLDIPNVVNQHVAIPPHLSLSRAATAISLLLQQLWRVRDKRA